jgi:hypothetical protein
MMMRNALKSVGSWNLLVSFSISWMIGGTVPVNAFPWSHNSTTVQCLRQQISNMWITKIAWWNRKRLKRGTHTNSLNDQSLEGLFPKCWYYATAVLLYEKEQEVGEVSLWHLFARIRWDGPKFGNKKLLGKVLRNALPRVISFPRFKDCKAVRL